MQFHLWNTASAHSQLEKESEVGRLMGWSCNGKGLKSLEEGEGRGLGAACPRSQDCF